MGHQTKWHDSGLDAIKNLPRSEFPSLLPQTKATPSWAGSLMVRHFPCTEDYARSSRVRSTNHFIVVFVWSDRQTHRDQTGPGRWNVHSPLPCGFEPRRHDISFMPPSSNRLGRQILNLGIRVRTPVGVPTIFRIVQPEMGWGRHRRVLGLASRHRNKNRE